MINKLETTKYILLKLCNWYYELNPEKRVSGENDLSILKSLKLIFLLSTIRRDIDNKNLLDFGFKFRAMPYGPVESEIYDEYKNGNLKVIREKGIDFLFLNQYFSNDSFLQIKDLIDENLEILKKENYYLISNSASYLVDLTHIYPCWIKNFKKATKEGRFSIEIPTEDIKKDKLYYSL